MKTLHYRTGLAFASTYDRINKVNIHNNFEEICWRMCFKFYFRNEPKPDFNNVPSFTQINRRANYLKDILTLKFFQVKGRREFLKQWILS